LPLNSQPEVKEGAEKTIILFFECDSMRKLIVWVLPKHSWRTSRLPYQ
jgi:hypothetical protein